MQSFKIMMMTARESKRTLEDHRFTGNALDDFGLSDKDTTMSGMVEACPSDEEISIRSSNTQASTVKMANLKRTTSRGPLLPPPPPSNASATDGTDVSSLDQDDTHYRNKPSLDAFTVRILVFVGLIFIGLSIFGGFMFWFMFPSITSDLAGQHPQQFKGTIGGIAPTASPSPTLLRPPPRDEPADLFSDTGEPSILDCPEQAHTPAPPLPGKKGMVLNLDEYDRVHLERVSEINPYWNYSRGPRLPRNQPDILEYIPMIPNANDYIETSQSIVDLLLADSSNHKRVMGYYEPDDKFDHGSRTSMSVDAAIHRWQLLEELQVPLVSPSARDATGSWMREFMQHADDKCLRIDWIGVHWYGGKSFHNFKVKMEQIYNLYGQRPLLLTEFSTVDRRAHENGGFDRFTEKDVLNFMKQAIPWLEAQEWIAGYAWHNFAANHTAGGSAALFDLNGDLTTVGRFYASVRTDNPEGTQSISV